MSSPPPAPTSLYESGIAARPDFPPLDGSARADVCIIGGGYTGLSVALHLAERGLSVVLLEAGRVGSGASGLNGGQLHSGQRRDQAWLERRLGDEAAMALWRMAEEAKALVHDLIRRHGIACDFRPGVIEALHRERLVPAHRAHVDHLAERYGYREIDWLDRAALAARIGTDVYAGGSVNHGAGHLDPLKLALGLAEAAAKAGARIHEGTKAVAVAGAPPRVETARGTVTADIVILAGNGYLAGIDAETERRVMPIANYIVATEPIGAGMAGGLIPGGEAVADSRFVVNYWRPSPDGRLIFGGGETYRSSAGADMLPVVRGNLLKVYPQLAGVRIDHCWGGVLAVTINRLPFVRRVRPGIYAAGGYSGQGVALAPFAGKVLAEAIAGDAARFDRLAALPCPPFPGGRLLRAPLLAAAMRWYALRDRL